MPKQIVVKTQQRNYPVLIGRDLGMSLVRAIQKIMPQGKILIVTHPNLFRIYGKHLVHLLNRVGLKTLSMTLPQGEASKSQKFVSKIYSTLLRHHFTRSDAVLALGGGVIGDVGAFAASTYMRGLRLIHVPTSLLAQVDSAIGGKTAIDLAQGKNLIGTFYQPHLVACDVSTLRTLPMVDLKAQLAEVIKYGVIQKPALFSYLEKNMARILKKDLNALEHIVKVSVQIKARVVALDEEEKKGIREILNYGHTFAHAFETVGKYKKLSHGQAVALGMICAARLAVNLKIFSRQEEARQMFLIQKAGLPTSLKPFSFSASQVIKVMKHDKKVKNGHIRFVLPQKIGKVIVRPILESRLHRLLLEMSCGKIKSLSYLK